MLDQRNCGKCGAELFEDPAQTVLPCPVCGSSTRNIVMIITEAIPISDGYRFKHRQAGMKRPAAEERNEPSFFVRDNEWHRRFMLVDRKNDVYIERITRMNTGEVILEKQEKLSEHLGRGDDKTRKSVP